MDKLNILRTLSLGNSIAEYDKNLSSYFIDTNYVNEFVNGKYDIVKGVKGAGKTAMLVALTLNKSNYKQLDNVKLVQAINLTGDPDFKRVFAELTEPIDEQDLIDAWKIYIINIVWKSIIDTLNDYGELEKYLKEYKLITKKPGFLAKILYSFQRIKPKFTNTFNPDGSYTQGVEFQDNDLKDKVNIAEKTIDFNYIFSEINHILHINDCKMWVMMDRLDDAFPDKTTRSINALKSLLYAYKDISVYDNFKVKIFIRDDIYKNVTQNGFTSLTHVASNTMAPIEWNREKLSQLLVDRLKFNDDFKKYLDYHGVYYNEVNDEVRNGILKLIFKKQVDVGKNSPDSFKWIINHITDGLGIFTPRDLINLIDKARQYQIDEWVLNGKMASDDYLIGATALRKALSKVSEEKIETQLYAEYPDLRKQIEKFKNAKAEHDENSLKQVLGVRWRSIVERLVNIGFIEEKQASWKIPFIYREGLNISQGKAFK